MIPGETCGFPNRKSSGRFGRGKRPARIGRRRRRSSSVAALRPQQVQRGLLAGRLFAAGAGGHLDEPLAQGRRPQAPAECVDRGVLRVAWHLPPMPPARSRHASVRSLERCARPAWTRSPDTQRSATPLNVTGRDTARVRLRPVTAFLPVPRPRERVRAGAGRAVRFSSPRRGSDRSNMCRLARHRSLRYCYDTSMRVCFPEGEVTAHPRGWPVPSRTHGWRLMRCHASTS